MNSVKLINYIQPTGEYITFFSELDSELKVGDKVFIVGGNYDNTIYTDKDSASYDIYHPYATGYKVVSVDNTDNSNAITLNIKYSDAIFNKDGISTIIFDPLPVYNDTHDIKEAYLSKSYFKRGEFLGGTMSGIFGNTKNEEDSLFNNKFSNQPAEAENMIFVGGKFNWGHWKNIWNKNKKGKKQTLSEYESPKNPRDENKFNIVGFSDNNGGFGYSYLVAGSVGKIYESLHNFNVSSDGVLYFLDFLPYPLKNANLELFKLTFEIESTFNTLRYDIKSVDVDKKIINFESIDTIFNESTFVNSTGSSLEISGDFIPRNFKLYVADSENIKNNINGITGLKPNIYSTTLDSIHLLGGDVYGGIFKTGISSSSYSKLNWYNGIVDGKKDATFFDNINWKNGIFKDGNWRGDSVVSIKNYTINNNKTFTVSVYKKYIQLFTKGEDVFISYIKRSIGDEYFDNFTEYPTKNNVNFGTFKLLDIVSNTSNNLFTDLILEGSVDTFDSEISLINAKISQSEFIKGVWLDGKWESGLRKTKNKIVISSCFIISTDIIIIITPVLVNLPLPATTTNINILVAKIIVPSFKFKNKGVQFNSITTELNLVSSTNTDKIAVIYLNVDSHSQSQNTINIFYSFAAEYVVTRKPNVNHIILAEVFIPKFVENIETTLIYDYFSNYRETKEFEIVLETTIDGFYPNQKLEISNYEIVKKIEIGIIDGTVNDTFQLDDRGVNEILERIETLNELIIKSISPNSINVKFVNKITTTDSNIYVINENIFDIRPIHSERESELTESVWVSGDFNSGVWDGGIFRNGNIKSKLYFDQTDINNQIVFKNGYFKDGNVDNSTIVSSIVDNGNINNKTIITNHKKDMVIYNATINDVEYRRGLLKKATVNGGKFIGGSLENVNFVAGQYTNGLKTFDNTYNTNKSGKLTPDKRYVDISAPSIIYIDGDGWVQLDQPSYYQTDYNVIFKDLTLFPNPLEGQMFDIRDKDEYGTRIKIDYLADIENSTYLLDDFKDLKPIVAIDNLVDFAQISENVYWVADSTNKRILIIDYFTKKVKVLGKIGLYDDIWNFNSISFISAPLKYKESDIIKNVYVVDGGTRIRRFDLDGTPSFEYANILSENETIISIDSTIEGKTAECAFYLTSKNRILYTINDSIKVLDNIRLINMSQISTIRKTTSNSVDMFILNNNTISHIILDLSGNLDYIIRTTSPYIINKLENSGVVIKNFSSLYTNDSNINLIIIYENIETNDVVKFIYSEYYNNQSNNQIKLNDIKLEHGISKTKISQTTTKELLSVLIVNNYPVVLASSSLSKTVVGFANVFSTTRLYSFTEYDNKNTQINYFWVYDDFSDRIVYVNESLPNLYDSETDIDTTLISDGSGSYTIHKMVNSESNNAIYSIQSKKTDNSYSIRRTERGIEDSNNEKIYTINGVSKIHDIVYVDHLYVLCQDSVSTTYKIVILDTLKLTNNLEDLVKYDLNFSVSYTKTLFDIVLIDSIPNVMLVGITQANRSDIYRMNLTSPSLLTKIYSNFDEHISGIVFSQSSIEQIQRVGNSNIQPLICFFSFKEKIVKVMTDVDGIWTFIRNTYYTANNQITDISKDKLDSSKIIISIGTNFATISTTYISEENTFDSFVILDNDTDIIGLSHNRLIKSNTTNTVLKYKESPDITNITLGVYDQHPKQNNNSNNINFLLNNAKSTIRDSNEIIFFIDSNKIKYYKEDSVYSTVVMSGFAADIQIIDLCYYSGKIYFLSVTNSDTVKINFFYTDSLVITDSSIITAYVADSLPLQYTIPDIRQILKKFSICRIPATSDYLIAILSEDRLRYGISSQTNTSFVSDLVDISDISLIYNNVDIKLYLTVDGVLKFIPYDITNNNFSSVDIEEVENNNSEYITVLNEYNDKLSIYDKANNVIKYTDILLTNRNNNITIIDFAINPLLSSPNYYFIYVNDSLTSKNGIIRQPANKNTISDNIIYNTSTSVITKMVAVSDTIVYGYAGLSSSRSIYKYDFSTNTVSVISIPVSEDSNYTLKAKDISHYTENNYTSLLIIYEYAGPRDISNYTKLFSVYTYNNTHNRLDWLYLDNKMIYNDGTINSTTPTPALLKPLFISDISPKIYGGYINGSPYIMLYFGQYGDGRFLKLTNKLETETLSSIAYNNTIVKVKIPSFNKNAEIVNNVYVNNIAVVFGTSNITIGSDTTNFRTDEIWISITNVSTEIDIKVYTTLSGSRISEEVDIYEQGIYDFRVYDNSLGNYIQITLNNTSKIDTVYNVQDYYRLIITPLPYPIYNIFRTGRNKLLKNAVIPSYSPNINGTTGIVLPKTTTDVGLVLYNTNELPLFDNSYIFNKIIKGYKVIDTDSKSKSILSPYLTARVLYDTTINQSVSYNSLGSVYTAHLVSSKWNNPNTFLGTWDQPRYVNNKINPVYSVFMKGIFEGDFYDGFFIGGEFKNTNSKIISGHFISSSSNNLKISSGKITNNWRYDVHSMTIDANKMLTIKTEGILLDKYEQDYSNYPISEIGKNSYIGIPNVFNQIDIEVFELRTYRIDVNGKKEIVLLVKNLKDHLIANLDKIFIESYEYSEYLFGEYQVLNIFKKDDISYITINSELPYFTNNSYVPKIPVKIRINSLIRVSEAESYKEGYKYFTNLKVKINTDLTDIFQIETLFFKPSITIINNNVIIPSYTQLFNTTLTKSENSFEAHFSDTIQNVYISNISPKNAIDPSIVEIASSSVIAHDIMVSESKIVASMYDKNSWIENSIILSGQIFANLRTTSVLNLDNKGFSNNTKTAIGDIDNSYIFEGDNTEITTIYFDTNRFLWIELKDILFDTDKYRYITIRGLNGKNSTMIGNTRSGLHRIIETKNNLIKIANPFISDPSFNFDYLTLQTQSMLLKDNLNNDEIRTYTNDISIQFKYAYASQSAMNGGDFYGDFYSIWNKGNFRKGNFYGKWFGSEENKTWNGLVYSGTTKNIKGGYITTLELDSAYDFSSVTTGVGDYVYVKFNSFFHEGSIIESSYGNYYGTISYDGDHALFSFESEFNIPNKQHHISLTKYRTSTKLLTDFNANIKSNYDINTEILESNINTTTSTKSIKLDTDKGIILNNFEINRNFAVSMLFKVDTINTRSPLFSFLNSKNGFSGIRAYVDTDNTVKFSYTFIDSVEKIDVKDLGSVINNTWYHVLINVNSDLKTISGDLRILGSGSQQFSFPITNFYIETEYDINLIGKDFVVGSDKSVNTYVYKGYVDEFVVWTKNIQVLELFDSSNKLNKIVNKNVNIISTFIDSELKDSNYYPRQSDYFSLSKNDKYVLDYTYSKDNVFLDIDIFIEQATVITHSLDEYKILTVEERRYVDNDGSEYVYTLELIIAELDKNRFNFVVREKVCLGSGALFYPPKINGIYDKSKDKVFDSKYFNFYNNFNIVLSDSELYIDGYSLGQYNLVNRNVFKATINTKIILGKYDIGKSGTVYINSVPSITGFVKNINMWERSENTTYLTYRIFSGENTDTFSGNITDKDSKNLQIPYFNNDGTNTWSKLVYGNESNFTSTIPDTDIIVNSEYTKTALPDPEWLNGVYNKFDTSIGVIPTEIDDIYDYNYMLTQSSGSNPIIISNMSNFRFFSKQVVSNSNGDAFLNVSASGYLFFTNLFNGYVDLLRYPHFSYSDNTSSNIYNYVNTEDAIMFNSIIDIRESFNGGVEYADRENEFIIKFYGKSTNIESKLNGDGRNVHQYTTDVTNPSSTIPDSFYAIRLDKINSNITFYIRRIGESNEQKLLGLKRSDGLWNYMNDSDSTKNFYYKQPEEDDIVIGITSDTTKYSNNTEYIVFVPRFNVKDETNQYITHIANKDYDYLKQYGVSVKKQFNARGLNTINTPTDSSLNPNNIIDKYYVYNSNNSVLNLTGVPINTVVEYPVSEQYDITNTFVPTEMSYYENFEAVNRDSIFYSGNFNSNVWYNGIFVDGIINKSNFIWKYGIKHNGTLSGYGSEGLKNYAHWLGGYHYGESDKSFMRNLIWNRGSFVGGNWESGYWMSLNLLNIYLDIDTTNKKDKWSIFSKGEWSSINDTVVEVSSASNLFVDGDNGTFENTDINTWNLKFDTNITTLTRTNTTVDTKTMCKVTRNSSDNNYYPYSNPSISFEGNYDGTTKIFVKRNTIYTITAKVKLDSAIGGVKIEAYTDISTEKVINISNIGYEKISVSPFYQYNVSENVNYYDLVAEDNLVNISHTFDTSDNDYILIKTSTYKHVASTSFIYYIDDIQMLGIKQQSVEFNPYDLKNHASVWSGGTFISDQVQTGVDNLGNPMYAKYTYQSNTNKLYRVKNNQTLTLPKVESIMLGGLWLRGVVDGGILANMFFHSTKADNTGTSIGTSIYEAAIKHSYDITASKFLKGKLINTIWYGGTVENIFDKREVIFGDLLNLESDLNHNDIYLPEVASNSSDIYAYNFKRSDFSDAYNKIILGRPMFNGYHYNAFNDGTKERIIEIENSRVYNQFNNDGIYGVYIKRISFDNGIIQFSDWDSLDLSNNRQTVISSDIFDNNMVLKSVFKKGYFYSSTFNAGLIYANATKSRYPFMETDENNTLFYYSHLVSGYWKAVGLKNNNDQNTAYYSSLDTTDGIEITNALFSRGVWDSGVFEGGVMDLSIWRSGVKSNTITKYKNDTINLTPASSGIINQAFYVSNNGIPANSNIADSFTYNDLPFMENGTTGLTVLSTIASKEQYRYMGNVDNLASIFVNGHMRGCVWHGGTFMRGIFQHKDNTSYDFFDRLNANKFNIGIWNRGLWLSGYFSLFDENWIDTANNTNSYLYYKNIVADVGRRSLFMSMNAINVSDNTTILGMNNTVFDNLVASIASDGITNINNYASLFGRRLLKGRTDKNGIVITDPKKPYFSLMNGSFLNGILYQQSNKTETDSIFSAYATISTLYHKTDLSILDGVDHSAFQKSADYSKSNIDKFKIPYSLTPIIFDHTGNVVHTDININNSYIKSIFNNSEQNGGSNLNSSNLHKWRHNYNESISTTNFKIGDGTIVNGVNGLREMTIGNRIVQISIAQGAGIIYLEQSDKGEPKYEGGESELLDINRYFDNSDFFSGTNGANPQGGFFTSSWTPLP